MASDASLLTAKFKGDRLELAAGGSWTAAHAGELEALVDGVAQDAARARSVSIDMGGVRQFDTYGAWLLATDAAMARQRYLDRRHAGTRPNPAQGDERSESRTGAGAG